LEQKKQGGSNGEIRRNERKQIKRSRNTRAIWRTWSEIKRDKKGNVEKGGNGGIETL
jgi:hypothetical protein